jgi:hypothetical protein
MAFYQNWLAQAGWTETAPIEQIEGAVEMKYTNGWGFSAGASRPGM